MFVFTRILHLVCLSLIVLGIGFCVVQKYSTQKSVNQNIERNTMNSNKTFQVTDHEVTFQNAKDGITLSGTLSVPGSTDNKLAPVVILVPGMGAVDRDCTFGAHKLFLTISQYLTSHGIAVLRYDKRGVGKSGGVFNMTITSADLSRDVLAAVQFLTKCPEINSNKIGLIGVSEGGLISFMVASECPDVKFMISMAGAVITNSAEQAGLQLKADGASDEFIQRDKVIRSHIFDTIQTHSPEQAERMLLVDVKSYVDSLTEEEKIQAKTLPFALTEQNYQRNIATFNSAWFRFFLQTESMDFISRVSVPVLAINGELDFIMSSKLALPKIAAGLKKTGNQHVTIVSIPNQNHWFQECKTGAMSEYGSLKETVNESTLKLMADWISKTAEPLKE